MWHSLNVTFPQWQIHPLSHSLNVTFPQCHINSMWYSLNFYSIHANRPSMSRAWPQLSMAGTKCRFPSWSTTGGPGAKMGHQFDHSAISFRWIFANRLSMWPAWPKLSIRVDIRVQGDPRRRWTFTVWGGRRVIWPRIVTIGDWLSQHSRVAIRWRLTLLPSSDSLVVKV